MPRNKKTNQESTVPVEQAHALAEASAKNTTQSAPSDQNQVQVDVDLLRTMRPHIAMPCYGGQLTESCFMSVVKWANTAQQLGIQWTLETMTNESLISRARNTLTAKFLALPDATHLFFLDADIGWEPWHLLVLMNRNVDLVGGLYPLKSIPLKWCVNGFEGAEEGPDGFQEVSKTGTGFMLIKRGVFETLNNHPSVKPYKNDIGLDPAFDKYMKTYFDTSVRQGRYYSEDWLFCENFRDLGGKVWVDKRVLLKHTGTYTFSNENQEAAVEALGPLYVDRQVAAGKIKLVDQNSNNI